MSRRSPATLQPRARALAALSSVPCVLLFAGCVSGIPSDGGTCSGDDDCEDGQLCRDGTCATVCNTNGDCAPDEACEGLCVEVDTPACRA